MPAKRTRFESLFAVIMGFIVFCFAVILVSWGVVAYIAYNVVAHPKEAGQQIGKFVDGVVDGATPKTENGDHEGE